MIRRRRPLLRAAMLGGVGYAGYKAGERATAQPQQASPPEPPPESEADRFETLARLKALLDSGALTQEEFDAEKQRILRS